MSNAEIVKKIHISQETFIIYVKLPVTCDTVKLLDRNC